MISGTARQIVERIARESYGRLVALLVVRTRDVASAEDLLAEAFAAALEQWPTQGVPTNPDGWLVTVAKRRHLDVLRRGKVQMNGEPHLLMLASEVEEASHMSEELPDRRLALMFACAHPLIERWARAPLILQTVLGITAKAIASAFLVSPRSMSQRLVRAKAHIKESGIPFSVPDQNEMPARLNAVLEALYAAYSTGWDEGHEGDSELSPEAIWLSRLIVTLLPEEPEAKALLAMMLYAEARRSARHDSEGRYVPIDLQDVALWDRTLISNAEILLHACNRSGPTGRYQLEAAIQSAHIAQRLTGANCWPAIVALYDHLVSLTNSPVAVLNRAAALAEVVGPAAALAALSAISNDKRILGYQPYWATLGHLNLRAGNLEVGCEALRVAIGLSTDNAVRQYLRLRLPREGPAPSPHMGDCALAADDVERDSGLTAS
jgi:RNA polymerase sigma-70 factor (ECF subfamily)